MPATVSTCIVNHTLIIHRKQVEKLTSLEVLTFNNNFQCVVPENIHTPIMEGIGNSEGEGEGGQRLRKFQRGGIGGGGLYDRFSFQRCFDSIRI